VIKNPSPLATNVKKRITKTFEDAAEHIGVGSRVSTIFFDLSHLITHHSK
jgi:hypothetical protein